MKRFLLWCVSACAWLFSGCAADAFSNSGFSEAPLTGSAWSETVTENGITLKLELFFTTSTEVKIRITTGIGTDALSVIHQSAYTYNPPFVTLTLPRETVTGRVNWRSGEIIFGDDEDDLWDDYEDDDDFLVFNRVNDAKWPE